MDALMTVVREVFGLFVDDAAFALAVAAWSVMAWVALPHVAGASDWGGIVFFAGLSVILVWGAWHRSRR